MGGWFGGSPGRVALTTGDWATVRAAPPGLTPPPPGECHLWPVPVLKPGADEVGWLALLDAREREQAAGYRVAHARRVFLTSRAAQRLVAAHYTGEPAGRVVIERYCPRCGTGDHGRPRVRGGGDLDLSVTHGGGWVLLGVVGAGSVGVDLEPHGRPAAAVDDLAGAVLTPAERERFDALDGDDRAGWFYRCWTRKEATTKLTGHGLAAGFRRLDVRGDRAVTVAPPRGWPDAPIHLTDLAAPPGYAAALATTAPVRQTRFHAPNHP